MPSNSDSLTFTTRVDLSGLQSGMAQAAQTVQSGAQNIAQAMTAAQVATQNLAQAQQQLGPAAALGNAQAQAVIQQYQQALQQAQAAVQQFMVTQQQQTQAAVQNAAANTTAAAATNQVGISARQAAGSGIGILEGRMMSGNRAAAALLTTTLGLGPVIQAAFPVIGALALVEVLYDIGKGVVDAYNKFISLDAAEQKLYDDVKKLQTEDFVNVHSIEDATLRLNEANESASKLLDAAHALQSAGWSQILQGNLGAGIGAIVAGRQTADASNKAKEQSFTLDQRSLELQHQLNTAKIEAAHSSDGELEGEAKINAELQKRLAINAENQRYTAQRDKMEGNISSPNSGKELEGVEDQAARGQAAVERLQLAQQQAAQAQKERGDNALAQVRAGSEEAASKLRIDEALTKSEAEALEVERKRQELQEENASEGRKKDVEQNKQLGNDQTKGSLDQIQSSATVQEALVRYQQAAGALTPLRAAYDEAKIHAQEFAQELNILNQRLIQQQELGDKTGAAQTQNQITQVQGRASVSALQDQTNVVSQFSKPFQSAFDSINNDWLQLQGKLIFGTHNIGAAFANMGVSMLTSVAASIEQMGAKWLEHEIMVRVLHLLTNQTKIASDATAAAQSNALTTASAATKQSITSATNVSEVLSYAAVAAAEAAASVAAVPLVGPALAAAAAASTFGEVASFATIAAFGTGGIIPNTGVALVHQGEAVLPRNLTDMLMDKANNGGPSAGSGLTVNHYSSYHGNSNQVFRSMLERNAPHVARAVQRAARQSGKSGRG